MNTQTPPKTKRIVGTCETDGTSLLVRSPYNPSNLSFFQSLPHSRFLKSKSAWRCDATPYAAYLIGDIGISLDEPSKTLYAQWAEGELPPRAGEITELLVQFKTRPWNHQQRAMSFAINKSSTLLAMEMGTGKTLTTICLLQAWKSRMNLILCPKSVLGVWRREFAKHCGMSHLVVPLEGSTEAKVQQLRHAKLRSGSYAITAVVINYESSWREGIGEELQSIYWDAVVADESHRIKTMDSNQSKFAATLTTISRRRLALTGTVLPNGEPIEALGQYRFLEPALFGTTVSRFQTKYCVMSKNIPGKVESYHNQDEFKSTFAKIAFRVQAKDVLTLPECQHITIPVTLNKKTRDYYEKMKRECMLELEQGTITAANAAVKAMRLHQIACGHSKSEDGQVIRLGNDKQEVLEDMISDLPKDEKIVVYCRFIEDLRQIEEVAKKLGRVYGEISGARKDITDKAEMPDHVQVMGVQYRAGGTGIDLTKARYGFWFSACETWGEYDQTNARIHRPGQSKHTYFYHLTATSTVDIKIYRALRNKQSVGLEILKSLDHKDEDE